MKKWLEISSEVYRAIRCGLGDVLTSYGGFTNVEGNSQFGNPAMDTEWGLKDTESHRPLIRSEAKKEYTASIKSDWDWTYYIINPLWKDR